MALERADNLAIVIIAALEGAIILARIRRDLIPLDALVLELGPVLDAVARPAASGNDCEPPTPWLTLPPARGLRRSSLATGRS